MTYGGSNDRNYFQSGRKRGASWGDLWRQNIFYHPPIFGSRCLRFLISLPTTSPKWSHTPSVLHNDTSDLPTTFQHSSLGRRRQPFHHSIIFYEISLTTDERQSLSAVSLSHSLTHTHALTHTPEKHKRSHYITDEYVGSIKTCQL